MNNNSVIQPEDIEQLEVDHYEESAKFIKLLHSQFRKMGYSLASRKKRAPVRVLEAVLFEPLEEIKLEGQVEKELFAICRQVMYHKNKITEYAIKRAEAAQKEGEKNE